MPPINYNKAFGRALQYLRREKAWSQEYLGFEAGLTRTTISLLERGLHSPTLDTMMALTNALDVPLPDLIIAIFSHVEEGKNRT